MGVVNTTIVGRESFENKIQQLQSVTVRVVKFHDDFFGRDFEFGFCGCYRFESRLLPSAGLKFSSMRRGFFRKGTLQLNI